MIGSHNTFTYLYCNKGSMQIDSLKQYANKIKECTGLWRCQDKLLTTQYALGVRYFDVRVSRETVNGISMWRVGHGAADLVKYFTSLESICLFFQKHCPDAIFRLVLEKIEGYWSLEIKTLNKWDTLKSSQDITDFKTEVNTLSKTYTNLVKGVIKYNWDEFYTSATHPTMKDLAYNADNWGITDILGIITNDSHPIKDNALKNNPVITEEMINDTTTCYFMDFI